MNHAIEVLEKELYLLEKVKKEFTQSEYEKAKERYEKKVSDLKKAIEVLQISTKNEEQIFEHFFIFAMKNKDFNEFKRTHPTLLRVILQSIKVARK